jgi:Xaa-Pro dipeptidase
LGEPDPEIQRVGEVLASALQAAIDEMKPGKTAGSIDAACREVINRAGYGDLFRKRTGYSMGVAFPPDWGEGHIVSLRPGDDTVLEEGMVFHLPPAVRAFRRFGVGMSESVLITNDGHEVLTMFDRRLITADKVHD